MDNTKETQQTQQQQQQQPQLTQEQVNQQIAQELRLMADKVEKGEAPDYGLIRNVTNVEKQPGMTILTWEMTLKYSELLQPFKDSQPLKVE